MDRICNYSTVIFASNVSVLLIVAITTDYWEYRGFRTDSLAAKLKKSKSNTTNMTSPRDTNTYVEVHYNWTHHTHNIDSSSSHVDRQLIYQPPAYLHRFYSIRLFISEVQVFNGTHNETVRIKEKRKTKCHDVLYLFTQYGNLFRECDNLEVSIRKRLDLLPEHQGRCFNFITSLRLQDDFVAKDLPEVIHLERIAFTLGLVCLISSVVSVVGGAYGSLMHDKSGMMTASSAALISGISLTMAIAVFHGKCHLIHRREFMAGIDIPYKKTIEDMRVHHHGWSFVLAWICVALCFIHSWVWLVKAQDTPTGRFLSNHRVRTQCLYAFQDSVVVSDIPASNSSQ